MSASPSTAKRIQSVRPRNIVELRGPSGGRLTLEGRTGKVHYRSAGWGPAANVRGHLSAPKARIVGETLLQTARRFARGPHTAKMAELARAFLATATYAETH